MKIDCRDCNGMQSELEQPRKVKMSQLFNYNCFDTSLDKNTRTLYVRFKEEKTNLSLELLFELESLLAWCTNRVEIRSIFFHTNENQFLDEIDYKNPNLSEKFLKTMQKKIQRIVFSMHHLPQTIIMDMGSDISGMALEFTLGADIRIANENIEAIFNHTKNGLVASSGGIGLLSNIVGQAHTRNFLLSSLPLKKSKLEASGLVLDFYNSETRNQLIRNLLESIYNECDVARIQTKMAIFENVRNIIEKQLKYDDEVSNASFVTEDWKHPKDSMKAKNMATAVKLSLVKSDSDAELPN